LANGSTLPVLKYPDISTEHRVLLVKGDPPVMTDTKHEHYIL